MDPPSLNPADVMAKANQSIPNTSSISADENALLQAKEKIKMIKHRVDSLKKQMNDYLITIKNWQLQQEKTCAFCAESIDPSAAVSKLMIGWSSEVSEMNIHVATTVSCVLK